LSIEPSAILRERDSPEIVEAAGQPSRAARDNHAPRLSQDLEASGKVRRLTDDSLLLGCCARADEVADHHEFGRDSDPRL
jgi:hypothetical protein